jgi:hypothetical protein
VAISNSGDGLSDHQVLLIMDTASPIAAGLMRTDGADLRFAGSNGTAPLPHWVESGLNTAQTRIWVRVPSLAAGGVETIFVYFGNAQATSQSSVTATFLRVIEASSPLVALWTFDEGTGTAAKDSSGSGANGTLQNGAQWTAGRFGSAIAFDDQDDVVEVPNTAGAFNLTTGWSVAAWVKPAAAGWNGRNDPIVWKVANSGDNEDTFILAWGAGSQAEAGLERASDGADYVAPSAPHTPGSWLHVVGTFDGSNLRIYVDGKLESSTGATGPAYTGPAPLYIGSILGTNHGDKGVFDGAIDEVQIYRRALTADEIAELAAHRAYASASLPGAVLIRKAATAEPSAVVGPPQTEPSGSSEEKTVLYVQAGTGNVGVGTDAPGRTLDVAGSARFNGQVDLALNELRYFRVHNAGSAPVACSPATAGVMYYDTAESELRYCNGTKYVAVGAAAPPPLVITPSSSYTQSLITGSSGTAAWNDRTYAFTSAPSGVFGKQYIRSPMSTDPKPCAGVSGANAEGGAAFTVNAPVRLTVACAHHCGGGEANAPTGSGWTALDGHYALTNHGGSPLHFYTKDVTTVPADGFIRVCCQSCWATGVFVEALPQ